MRTMWSSLVALIAALLLIAGCYSTERVKLKAPKHPESYDLPPTSDAKWDKPIEYPKGTLNKDNIKQDSDKDGPNGQPKMGGPQAPRFGAGAGGGGGY